MVLKKLKFETEKRNENIIGKRLNYLFKKFNYNEVIPLGSRVAEEFSNKRQKVLKV
jgi:hypothetical protein